MRPSSLKSGSGGCLVMGLVPLLLFLGVLGYLFLFSIKSSSEYACALDLVRKESSVLEAVGEPVEPGFFAWTSYFSEEPNLREATFGFRVSGPKGKGQVDVSSYRTPIGSSMTISYEGRSIYEGSYPCR